MYSFLQIQNWGVEPGQLITSGEDALASLVHGDSASMINDKNPHGRGAVAGDVI